MARGPVHFKGRVGAQPRQLAQRPTADLPTAHGSAILSSAPFLVHPALRLWKKWFNSSGWRPGSIGWRFPRQLQIWNSSVCRTLNMTLCWLEYLQVQIPSDPRKSVPFCSKTNLDKVFQTTFHKSVNIQRKAKFEACTKASLWHAILYKLLVLSVLNVYPSEYS